MKEELLKRLTTIRDILSKNGSADISKYLGEAQEAVVTRGALNDIDEDFAEQLFDIISEIKSIEGVDTANRKGFDYAADLIRNILLDK